MNTFQPSWLKTDTEFTIGWKKGYQAAVWHCTGLAIALILIFHYLS